MHVGMRTTTRSVVVLSLLLGACAPNISGVVAADGTGTLLDPPAVRESPLATIADQCGDLGPTDASVRREPYMQTVSASGARISWTSERAAAETLVVWTADGAPAALPSEVEPTVYLAGATQRGVSLTALEPATIHCYELRDEAGNVLYGPTGFRTAPLDDAGPIHIVAFGDSGFAGSDQRAVIDQLHTVPTDLILHVGDVAYDTGTMPELEATYFEMYTTLLSSVPVFPAIGDHDDATDGAGPYREAFSLPGNAGPAAAERYYSFDWGSVHVVVTDAINPSAAQVEFLERDLAAAEAAGQWMIAVASYPLYSSGFHGSYGSVRAAFEPVFQRHHVHLVLSGDDHDYERTVPIGGVTYMVTGGGGRSVRPVGTSSWTAFSMMALHFTYITIEGDVMRVRAIDATGREFDGVEIPRTQA